MTGPYTRLYLKRGHVSHAVRRADGQITAECGVWTLGWWYGTGNQDEYEKAAALPECKRCPSTKGVPHAGDNSHPDL